jgi:hypothetical protein
MKKKLLFLAFTTLVACSDQLQDVDQGKSITIEEAQSWFEANVDLKNENSKNPATSNMKSLKEPVWQYAKKHEFKGGQVITAPLRYDKGKLRKKGSWSKLMMYKDEQGSVQLRVMTAIGDLNYMSQHEFKFGADDFAGIIEIKDWDGNFISGERYENGKVTGTLEKVLKTSSPQARTAGYWIIIEKDWYQQICDVNGCGGWTYLDTFRYTIYVADGVNPSSYYGTFYSEGGSGGSGGTGGGGAGCPYGPNCGPIAPDEGEVLIDIEVVRPDDAEFAQFEQGYRAQMSVEELQIFDAMNRGQQIEYLLNAQEAINKANELYPTLSQLNDKADAFRHAYFSLLNVIDLGGILAERLGTAHENRPDNPVLQNAMDLFNNASGRNAYQTWLNNGGSPADIIQGLADSGELVIIKNDTLAPSNQ